MRPGSGDDKKLPETGDISIITFVAPEGIRVVEYQADLNFISYMAYAIAKGLKEALR
ncbi:hypothetical protein [Clostridium taeniosporum]|uniref:hypothetical protein n=1 Tax=Clostridium taeniosporum TaxID=394958 RepID=UPI001314179D|nr:hypothetical protein [Clostridium taeniosporum]